jgi:hypothetical protein
MIVALPAVLIFGAGTWLLVRSRVARMAEVIVIGLFGFFLATTGLGAWLSGAMASAFHLHH